MVLILIKFSVEPAFIMNRSTSSCIYISEFASQVRHLVIFIRGRYTAVGFIFFDHLFPLQSHPVAYILLTCLQSVSWFQKYPIVFFAQPYIGYVMTLVTIRHVTEASIALDVGFTLFHKHNRLIRYIYKGVANGIWERRGGHKRKRVSVAHVHLLGVVWRLSWTGFSVLFFARAVFELNQRSSLLLQRLQAFRFGWPP